MDNIVYLRAGEVTQQLSVLVGALPRTAKLKEHSSFLGTTHAATKPT